MYCKQCGSKIDDDAQFCENCGTLVKTVETKVTEPKAVESVNGQIEGAELNEADMDEQAGKVSSPKKKKILIIAIAAVALVALIVGVLLVVKANKSIDIETLFSLETVSDVRKHLGKPTEVSDDGEIKYDRVNFMGEDWSFFFSYEGQLISDVTFVYYYEGAKELEDSSKSKYTPTADELEKKDEIVSALNIVLSDRFGTPITSGNGYIFINKNESAMLVHANFGIFVSIFSL